MCNFTISTPTWRTNERGTGAHHDGLEAIFLDFVSGRLDQQAPSESRSLRIILSVYKLALKSHNDVSIVYESTSLIVKKIDATVVGRRIWRRVLSLDFENQDCCARRVSRDDRNVEYCHIQRYVKHMKT